MALLSKPNLLKTTPFKHSTIQSFKHFNINPFNHSTIQPFNNLKPNPLLYNLCLCLLLILSTLPTLATTITVKQDGTGDHTIIQEAIGSAADGDTVLVYPGTYFENVDFVGKNITLASLNLTTGDEAYIHSTIIDGNQSGSCVIVSSYLTNAVIHGLTLQNGSGTIRGSYTSDLDGGGIFIHNQSTCSVNNCRIVNNVATGAGGGIVCIWHSTLLLSGSTISNNHAYLSGGGIALGYECNFVLDTINLCSIFLNFSAWGCEFNKLQGEFYMKLDTCTVSNPDSYFFSSIGSDGYQVNDITFNIQNKVLIPVDADLYVNPNTGDNTNNGLSTQEPLQSIAFALSLIKPDSLNKNTIHLANGIYSDTINEEKFPLNIRSFINISGGNRNSTILDGNNRSNLIEGNNEVSEYSLSRMTLRRGTIIDYNTSTSKVALVKSYLQNENISFDSILFTQGHCRGGRAIVNILGSNNTRFTNCEFSDNKGDAALRVPLWDEYDTCRVYNSIFHDNLPDYDEEPDYQIGRALDISGGVGIVVNSLFYNNVWEAFTSPYPSVNYLANCTFTGNSVEKYAAIGLKESTTTMYNCISFNEGDYPFAMRNIEQLDSTRLNIYHSLIEHGEDDIFVSPYCDGWCVYHYDESNIEGDPLFYGGPDFPYNLSDDSPCIDAGTLDLPNFIELPDVDLAGNPRVVNSKIDIGAYEWNPTVSVPEIMPFERKERKLLQVGPNPFSKELKIFALFEKSANIKIEVFANSGLRVKTIVNGNTLPGKSIIRWNGRDGNGNILPAGIYNIIMTMDGKEAGRARVVKL